METANSIQERYKKIKQQRSRGFIKSLIIISFICTLFAVLFTWLNMRNVFFFVVLAFMPSLLSILWDKKPGRFASKSVSAFNFTGAFPYILSIFLSGSPDSTAINSLYDPLAWLLIYGFSGFGWGVVYIIPKITSLIVEVRSKIMIAKMEKMQTELIDEWGEDVKG
ncbi:MAG: hypothetical protein SFT90_02400 [Rickettsiales bacterium]|nr:hypothetical protein [Rickettsiales bacterium]